MYAPCSAVFDGSNSSLFARGVDVGRGEAAVEATDGLPLVAQQLLAKAAGLDPQVRALDVVRGQAGQPRDLLRDRLAARRRSSSCP